MDDPHGWVSIDGITYYYYYDNSYGGVDRKMGIAHNDDVSNTDECSGSSSFLSLFV
jgi:hypothetical protein